jgi:hypothetical protein
VGTLPEVEDLDWFGALDQYNDFYDKVSKLPGVVAWRIAVSWGG